MTIVDITDDFYNRILKYDKQLIVAFSLCDIYNKTAICELCECKHNFNLFVQRAYLKRKIKRETTYCEQEGMSPLSAVMTCGRPCSCRASHVQAPTENWA